MQINEVHGNLLSAQIELHAQLPMVSLLCSVTLSTCVLGQIHSWLRGCASNPHFHPLPISNPTTNRKHYSKPHPNRTKN